MRSTTRVPRAPAMIADPRVITDDLPTPVQAIDPEIREYLDHKPLAAPTLAPIPAPLVAPTPVVVFVEAPTDYTQDIHAQDFDDRYMTPNEAALVEIVERVTGDLPRPRTPLELLLALDTSRAKR